MNFNYSVIAIIPIMHMLTVAIPNKLRTTMWGNKDFQAKRPSINKLTFLPQIKGFEDISDDEDTPVIYHWTEPQITRKNIVCYYTNWAQYRPNEWVYVPEDIDPKLCTHYIYAFAVIEDETFKIKPYEWNDEETEQNAGMYRRFVKQIRKGPGKALLAVGGWNFGMRIASKMMMNETNRKMFIASCIELLRKYDFEGLDVDFEYPANLDRESLPRDRDNFVKLLRELRTAFEIEAMETKRPRLLLSAAVAPLANRADLAYEPGKLAEYLDFLSIMAYDMHGAWDNYVGFNAPLLPSRDASKSTHDWCLKTSAEYWDSVQKFPKERMNIGLANYGRSYTLLNQSNTYPWAPATGPGKAGRTTQEPGVLSFFEICELLNETNSAFKRTFDRERLVPYITNGKEWVGYDDLESIWLKTEYIKCRRYGGVMFWTIDFDDFHGKYKTDGDGKPYPLIRTAKQALMQPINEEFCKLFR